MEFKGHSTFKVKLVRTSAFENRVICSAHKWSMETYDPATADAAATAAAAAAAII